MVEYIFFSALVKSSVVAAEVCSAAFHDFIYSIVASTANSLSVFRSIMKSPFLWYSAMAVACTTSIREMGRNSKTNMWADAGIEGR